MDPKTSRAWRFLSGSLIVFVVLFFIVPNFYEITGFFIPLIGERATGFSFIALILLAAGLIGSAIGEAIGKN